MRTNAYTFPLALAALDRAADRGVRAADPPAKQTKSPPAKSETKQTKQAAPPPAPGGGQPTLLGQFGEWGAYSANSGGKKICYALAKPTRPRPSRQPSARSGLYVHIHAADRKRAQRDFDHRRLSVQTRLGGDRRYRFEQVCDVYAGRRRLDQECGRRGAHGRYHAQGLRHDRGRQSGRGTKSTDRYALKGLSQALDRVAQECR